MNRIVSLRAFFAICVATLLSLNSASVLSAFEMSASRPVSIDITQSSATGTSLKLELGDLVRQEVINQGERYDRFPIDDQPIAGPAGRPELPALVKFVLIPPESGVSLRIKNLRTHIVRDVNPYPRQPEPLEKNIKDIAQYEASLPNSPLVIDEDFYMENSFWPEEHATLGEIAIMRGYRILPIRINPLRYNPVTHELEVVDGLELELDFTSDENRINLVENPSKLRPSTSVDKILQNMVVNPPNLPERDNGMRGGSILFVMGTGNGWNPVLAAVTPLIEWRRKTGWAVDVLRTNAIADANGTRQAIQAYYRDAEIPPEHVVLCGDTDGNFPVGFFNHQDGAGNPYESDHDFAMLEGNDILPELSVGRLIFDSVDRLNGIVNKTVNYESNPFIGDGNGVGWQKRGAVESVASVSGVSSNDLCRWTKIQLMKNGFTRVNELYWEQAGERDNRQFVIDNITAGIGFFLHRGHLWMNPTFRFGDVQGLQNGRMLPFVMIITCNTGDYGEHISDGGNGYFSESFTFHPSGAIGAIGCSGATHTAYNNIYCAQTAHAIYNQGIDNQGWANEAGKMSLYTHYAGRGDINHEENRNMQAWLTELYITNLMGDPSVDLFTSTPRPLVVTRPGSLRRGETHLNVNVLHDDDDLPALGATVCLYKSGEFQLVKIPDADGNVAFDLDPAWTDTEGDSVHLTVTGHNLFTFKRSYLINRAGDFVGASTFGIDDDDQDGSEGNDNGDANQLETIGLTIQVANHGGNDYEGQLTLNLTTDDPNLDVVEGEVDLDQSPAQGEAVPVNFLVRIGGGFPSGQNAVFNLSASVGQNTWHSSVSVPVLGPDLEFVSLDWSDAMLHRAANAELSITLRNVGSVSVRPFRATFFSLIRTIGPVVAEADFGAIAADENGESRTTFTVSAHPFHIGNRPVPVGLAIEADNGFIDTVLFDMPISAVVAGEPFGPDDYGYICFDNLDTNWFAVPSVDWVEIDPRQGGNGTNTNLRDGGESQDMSVVVDLPFVMQHYGQEFDQLTICSNGWVAPGDCHQLISARNRHIPGGECPPGMIAPFWEDLIIPQNSGVYTFHDRGRGMFIVEWSRLKKLGPEGGNEPDETFQVQLLDPQEHQNFTGDGDIIFQYLDITDNQSAFRDWDVPFASVGIASLDNLTGLEYSYWNARPGGAAPLRDGMAIKFTTLVEFRTGSMSGRVFDAATNEPLDSANVYTKFGFAARTDENGDFSIPIMLVDSSYTFTATKRFYSDSTITGEVLEAQNTYVEFSLLHPEFTLSAGSRNFEMLADSVATSSLILQNTGNGPLEFTSRFGYQIEEQRSIRGSVGVQPDRDDPDDAWELLRHWELGDSVNNSRLQAVAWVRDHWLVSGGRLDRDGRNLFYTFDREGRANGEFYQPEGLGGQYGFRDLEYENGNLWGVSTDEYLYQIDPDSGIVLNKWTGIAGLGAIRCVTRDPETGLFYLANTTGRIYQVELVNDTLMSAIVGFEPMDPRDNVSIRKYGFGWLQDEADGFKLYVIGINEVPMNNANHPDLAIFKINPETREVEFLTDLADQIPPTAGGRCGMTITHSWSNRVYALAAIIENASTDWLGIFEISANTSWISYEPKSGALEANEQTAIELEVNSTSLDTGLFEIMLDYTHNAAPGFQRIPVQMHVVSELPQFDLISPADGDTVALLLNRTDSVYVNSVRFVWEEPFRANEEDRFDFSLWFQMGEWTTHFETADTFLAVNLDTMGLGDGELTWWVEATGESGITPCRTPFHLRMIVLSANSDPTVPLEFGLHEIYPIPFNSRLTINFGIDIAEPARLAVYDMQGREVTKLFDGTPKIGNYKAVWDAGRVSSGVYVVRLESAGRVKVAKVVMVK